MLKKIRTSKVTKVIVCYLSIMIFLQIVQPMSAYALTEGPSQPEFNSFTPIGTSDMVDLSSGDFNYNIPIMDVGGYPINLAYNSGVTMDQEASWVGLGWNLNIGQINRNVRGLPDDFQGDEIVTENNLRNNITVGVQGYVNGQIIGLSDNTPGVSAGGGLNLQYNNYHGMTAIPSFGVSFKLSENVSVGMQLSSSNAEGASITPNVSLSAQSKDQVLGDQFKATLSPSLTYNSRQGLSSFNINAGIQYINKSYYNNKKDIGESNNSASGSGSISFLNNTFTPTKRLGLKNDNVTLSFSGGPAVWGTHIEASISASASVQKLIEKIKRDKAYGYEFTDKANESGLLDFNREKEETTVTKNTLVLPVTNYTYDILSIQGQGLGGVLRPYRGQVGYVYEPKVNDISSSARLGAETEGGVGAHIGASVRKTTSNSYTGNWNTNVIPLLKEKVTGNNLNYEKVYYKNTGENRIDNEYSNLFKSRLGKYSPITFKLDGNKEAINEYYEKVIDGTEASLSQVSTTPILTKLKREQREKRNQVVQKITNLDVLRFGLNSMIKYRSDAPSYHTAGYIITDENSSRHIYGETAYNNEKQEVTFATKKLGALVDGLVEYIPGENSINNSSGIDHYYNNVKTPKYAHTYLITSILSPDYEDLTLNGVSDDDLGSYTKFEYATVNNYKWRVPFKKASYNEGLKTNKSDQKGSYLYGTKELKYVTRIITKTHVAIIELEDRNDGRGTVGVDGGGLSSASSTRMKCIKTIRLYSKPEIANSYGVIPTIIPSNIKPIKTAHFDYEYSLCKKIDNNVNVNQGKLTLKKVYFTYRDSNMGKYTPYKFNYSETNNYDYNPKNYDIWGNYKENIVTVPTLAETNTTPQEFPYVDQNNQQVQNENASAWSLSSIELPSGSKIELTYESDDYQYVQNKKAMQMFKVAGVTTNGNISTLSSNLYGDSPSNEAKYVAVKINEEDENFSEAAIIDKYIGDLKGKAIYFNFFLNMKGTDRDYISGYFEMNEEALISSLGSDKFLLVPMKHINREGKFNNNNPSNPISVAGWFFGRENLNHQLYNDSFNPNQTNVLTIAKSVLSNLEAMIEIFKGPNGRLKSKGCAKSFIKEKSWIRLMEPSGSKLGGGARVKKVIMKDGWEKMMNVNTSNTDIERYEKEYGQEYSYSLSDGTSSGVATYEPNVCKENPLVQPFYHNPEKMAARSYQEKPFGESFFPTPTVTYRKVTVKNITSADDDNQVVLSKTRSGKVITEFYTSYDFPTKTDFTPLNNPIAKKYYSNENEAIQNMIKGMLGLKIDVKTDLTMSQGFVIETNDMNGKMKKQEVLNNSGDKISSVEYIYNTVNGDPTTLNSELTVINKDGTVTNDHALGLHYDVINDLRESYSETNVAGVAVNVDFIPSVPIPIVLGMGIPESSKHRQILHTSVTTKVINKTGILKEKIAYDLGSRVSTKNLAWDAQTGQVILTETINEYDDSYYSLSYPAYWKYDYMGMATENIDFASQLIPEAGSAVSWKINGAPLTTNVQNLFKFGDELITIKRTRVGLSWDIQQKKLWVSGYNGTTGVKLIKADGKPYNPDGSISNNRLYFRVIRSGYRNQQMAAMSSITLMKNPLMIDPSTGEGFLNQDLIEYNSLTESPANDPKIINASAIEYTQDWLSQCENGLPDPSLVGVNNYLYNVLGEWRPVRSYAYLTGRNAVANSNTRNSGYFKKFNPFYKRMSNNWTMDMDDTNWTFASEVTMYNPYGVELENRDALNRYSAAQYGYKYKLPIAVGSNSKYQEMGFDGFEDYFSDVNPAAYKPHFGFADKVNVDNYVTNKASHTGKKSVVVKGTSRIEFSRKVDACQ